MSEQSEQISITIPWDVWRTGPNTRIHWRERARRNKVARQAAIIAWRQAGFPQLTPPVCVQLIVRRGRVIDPDNALAGAKPLLDALLNRNRNGDGIIPEDSAQYVSYAPVLQSTGKTWAKSPEATLCIWEDRS